MSTTTRPSRTTLISSIISITLVLYMLGLLGFLMLNARSLSYYVKENLGFSVFINDDAKEVEVRKIKKNLDAAHFVKRTEYVDKEKAAAILKEELGEDFVGFLGFNPLLSSIDVYLEAAYVHPDSMAWIEKTLVSNANIKEVYYRKDLLALVNEKINRIGFVLILFSAMLLLIAFALINHSIRISVYSKRLLIRSMQLVGATENFIRGPFLAKGILQGLLGASLAILMLSATIFYTEKEIPELIDLRNSTIIGFLFLFVLILGVTITAVSTYFAVTKYLRMRSEKMY